jgi:hypothetical protein
MSLDRRKISGFHVEQDDSFLGLGVDGRNREKSTYHHSVQPLLITTK